MLLRPMFCACALMLAAMSAHGRFKDLPPVADAQVASGFPTTNYGDRTDFYVQSDGTGSFGDERGWLRFDLNGQIPPGATISAAKLRIYTFDADQASSLPVQVLGSTVDSWDETAITWNTQPATTGVVGTGTLLTQQPFRWYEFDVSAFVATEFASDGVVSLMVRATTESDPAGIAYRFNSREFVRDGYSLMPRLRVEFDGSWPTAGAVTVIHTNDIHSRLTTHDLDFPDAPGEAPALEEAGGAALLGAKVAELKKANPNALMLDAGDISEGNPLGDLRGNGGTVEYFQELNTRLKALPNNGSGRGVDGVVVGNHDVREAAMLANMTDPDGDGSINGWVGCDSNPAVGCAAFNPITTDPDDVAYLAVNLVRDGYPIPASPEAWPEALPYRPYVVVDAGGTRVGVLGYLTDDSAILTAETVNLVDVKETAWRDKGNGADYSDVVLLEPWVEHLRAPIASGGEEVDVVVLLSHIGHRRLNSDGDLGSDGDDELLGDFGAEPPDLVVSGHWHTWTSTVWQPNTLNYKTTNVEAASYSQYVGEVTLSATGRYLSSAKHPIRVSDFTVPFADADIDAVYDGITAVLTDLEAEYAALTGPDCVLDAATIQAQIPGYVDGRPCPLDYVVGHSGVDLILDKDKWFTLSEFPWSGDNTAGQWISDAMVDKVRSLNINGGGALRSNAHMAIQTGGGVRRDVAAGPITYREIFETYPWDDDSMVRVQMTSADVWAYLEGEFVGASISADWRITADDGVISSIEFDGDGDRVFETSLVETDTSTIWNLIISEYMYENESWISESGGTSNTFQVIDPTPEFIATDGTTSPTPVVSPAEPLPIRDSVVEYTAQFTALAPMDVPGPRYVLNTEAAGEFEAVVTMTNDAETQPYFEGVFVRLLNASAETLARRNLPGDPYNLSGLVRADGTIDPNNQFAETLLYRSHLGFPDGYLQPGDRLMIRGEFGFFQGNPQFVDQEGVVGAEEEFEMLLPAAPDRALPNYFSRASEFLLDAQENHLVKWYARRTGSNTVEDSTGQSVNVYREGGFFTSSVFIPGNNGDCVELIGVPTERADATSDVHRFRLREATDDPLGGGLCFPPTSTVALSGTPEAGMPLTLTATVEDLNGFGTGRRQCHDDCVEQLQQSERCGHGNVRLVLIQRRRRSAHERVQFQRRGGGAGHLRHDLHGYARIGGAGYAQW